MTFHAYAAQQPKSVLQPLDYDPPPLGALDVEIAITHCGVCHSDVHIIDGDWGGDFPAVAGHEIIGTVQAKGALVTTLAIGQRVGVGWQCGACLNCDYCLHGEDNLCASSLATCRGRYGGFADAIRVDSRFAHPIPDGLASENAAPLLCGGITVYAPMRQWEVNHMTRVGVVGIGGLGHLALQFARGLGCDVAAFSSTPAKAAEARGFGATRFINSGDSDALKAARNSLDFILVTANVQLDWNAYLRLLRPNGVLCFVGAIPGDFSVPFGALSRQRSVTNGVIGSRGAMRDMLDFSARHSIVAQTEALPFSEINAALERVRTNQARYRVVLVR